MHDIYTYEYVLYSSQEKKKNVINKLVIYLILNWVLYFVIKK